MSSAPYIILNGELRQQSAPAEPYIYQHLHTLDYRARHLEHHIDLLNHTAAALYCKSSTLSQGEIERDIELLLGTMRLSRKVSIKLTLKYYATDDYTIEYDEPSIYSGYVLRSLRYEAMLLRGNIPFAELPTSAGRHTRQMAEEIARAKQRHTAILVDAQGNVVCESTHPILIVKGYNIIISTPVERSVEAMIAQRAANRCKYSVEMRRLTTQDIASADEVLIISWQGITAIQSIGERQYMNIVAQHLADEM